MKKLRPFLAKFQNLDKRIVYAVFLIAVAIPLIHPLGIPIVISENTTRFYDEIETLKKDDLVVLHMTYDPTSYSDVHYQTMAVVDHLGQKGAKIYLLCGENISINYASMMRTLLEEKFGYVYGENVLISPWLAGAEQGIKTFSQNPKTTFEKDAYGTPMNTLPMMNDVNTIWDFKYAIAAGTSIGHEFWLKQVPGMKILAPIGSGMLANIAPYVDSGQVSAILPGVRSAAEYEKILGLPGEQLAKMDSQSLGILTILIFILLGNIGYFASKKIKEK